MPPFPNGTPPLDLPSRVALELLASAPPDALLWGRGFAQDIHVRIANRAPVIGREKAIAELRLVFTQLAALGSRTNNAWGEFCEIDFPRKLVMTRRFQFHPLLSDRETTITYNFEPSPYGTRVSVKDEGFIGRSEAAFGNAQIWEKVLSWLDDHLGSNT